LPRPDAAFYVASIRPRATTAEIAPGDAFDVLFTTPTEVVRLPRSLPPYFVTSPAVITYDVGAGPQAMSYPVASDGPGTNSHPIVMTSEQIGLTLYRPQSTAIPGAVPALGVRGSRRADDRARRDRHGGVAAGRGGSDGAVPSRDDAVKLASQSRPGARRPGARRRNAPAPGQRCGTGLRMLSGADTR